MLNNLKDLDGFSIHATDGNIGHVKDIYFDDDKWVVRYLVVETGDWLSSKEVLISPMSINHIDWEEKSISVLISQSQVKSSPDIATHIPISQQHERDYLGYYGYPLYWGSNGRWAEYPSPYLMAPRNLDLGSSHIAVDTAVPYVKPHHKDSNHHLRSKNEVIDCHVEAIDDEVGHVQGMLFDSETWAIRYLIINTSQWWIGHLVLIAPEWIKNFGWSASKIHVDISQEKIKKAPHYHATQLLDHKMEKALYLHYGRMGYWEDDLLHAS